MAQADLLYDGVIVTALMLSLWAAGLLTAACFFFAPAARRSYFSRSSTSTAKR
jgi:hypothetical protein